MPRIGLTGNLGSGKSTVATMLRDLGAHVILADELGRQLMEPGQPVFLRIVERFGPQAVQPDGRLNRPWLAEQAFAHGRLQELNALVHPAVIAAEEAQLESILHAHPGAIAVIESALIFEVERDARLRGELQGPLTDWRTRMDCVVVVTAPDALKIERFVSRLLAEHPSLDPEAARADARLRLASQIPDAEKAARADSVIQNDGTLDDLRRQVTKLWQQWQFSI